MQGQIDLAYPKVKHVMSLYVKRYLYRKRCVIKTSWTYLVITGIVIDLLVTTSAAVDFKYLSLYLRVFLSELKQIELK